VKDGFVRVAAAAIDITVAGCAENAREICARMDEAAGLGCAILVLPELCLTGYTCADLFLQDALIGAAQDALSLVLRHSASHKMLIFVGLPVRARGKLYNCAAVIADGRLLGLVPKSNLPNYAEFYETRQFTPAPETDTPVELCGFKVTMGTKQLFCCENMPELIVGCEICEDLWTPRQPSQALALAGATVIVNLSASTQTVGKDDYRRLLVRCQSARLSCGYLYADAGRGESTTDVIFTGHCMIAEYGELLRQSKPFENELIYSELDIFRVLHERRRLSTFPAADDGFTRAYFTLNRVETPLTRPVSRTPFVPSDPGERGERCEEILSMQAIGLSKRMAHTGAKCAVVGVSGGLDSTLALLICARAAKMLSLGADSVVAVTMPGFGTTGRTYDNAAGLAKALGARLIEIPIAQAVRGHFKDIGHDEAVCDVVYENAQARERTQILMDLSNKLGGFVVGTGDLSELALGWATYNGDHMSMYAINASIPKTLIRHLISHIASGADENLKNILMDVLDTPVSPELLPAEDGQICQKTEEIVGPYELHDFYLNCVVRWGFGPRKALRLANHAFAGTYDNETLLKWLRNFYTRFFAQQYKRSCLPDGPKVGSVTLSPRSDWRMPSDASDKLWIRELDDLG